MIDPRIRRLGEIAFTLLQAVIPKADIIVVQGTPVTEGNAVEIVSALSRRYQGRIVWLVDGQPQGLSVERSRTPVTFVAKWTFMGVYYYLRSEIVFYTHGLFGAVKPSRRQTFVNLWHGDGIKRKPTAEMVGHSLWPATYVSGGTRLLTERKAHDFKMPPGSELVYGNPRVVQFRDSVPASFLCSSGIGDEPFIIWMPTFRKSSITGAGYVAGEIREIMSKFVRFANDRGLQVVVKAHRQDAESRSIEGALSIDDAELVKSGVSLYSLIGASAALVTDYSSVWTDYLVLDRPIGFVIPDADTYTHSRGLYPHDVLSWLPGPILHTETDIERFVDEVVAGAPQASKASRDRAKAKLGLAEFDVPADRLLEELAARGCFRKGHLRSDTFHLEKRPRLVQVNG